MKPFKFFTLSLVLIAAFFLIGNQFLTYDAALVTENSTNGYYQYHAVHSGERINVSET